ncbi:MAG: ABC transporter permease [Gemmatimonadota bacterium]
MSFFQDVRYGARLMLRKPGYTLVTVLTLAVGIGLTGMMFSILNGALLKGLPFDDAQELMYVSRTDVSRGVDGLSVPLHDIERWQSEQTVFQGLATFVTGSFNVRGSEGAERYFGAWMSANAFDLLRVRPVLGRGFVEDDGTPGAALVAVLSHRVWQDRFGGDPGALGQPLHINGEEAIIVGVMEEGFLFPFRELIWLPERRQALDFQEGAAGTPNLRVFGRLASGVSVDEADAQMGTIAARMARDSPETHENLGALVQPFTRAFIGRDAWQALSVMLGAVFGVLLIACANVANLLLGQAAMRGKEVGIRSALGADRGRVLMQFLTEPLILALVGAVVGLGIAWVGVWAFIRAVPVTEPPFWVDFQMDGTVLLFVLAITLFATLASGLLPALRASRGDVGEILKDDSRSATSFRGGRLIRALVVGEVALSVTLVVAAGLMIRSVTELASIDFEYATEDILTARLELPEMNNEYTELATRVRFFEEVERRISADPAVRAVTLTSSLPGLAGSRTPFRIEGDDYASDTQGPSASTAVITPSYFDTFGVGIRQGRGFHPQDGPESLPVAVVNQSFAQLHFPDGTAIGHRIRTGRGDSDEPWLTIIGVVPDMHMAGVEGLEQAGFYTPLAQSRPIRSMSIAARSESSPLTLTPEVRNAVAGVDPDIPIFRVQTLAEGIRQDNWFFGVFGVIFAVMGGVGLFLAAIGLYGVLSFSVGRRTREMGVRMALGARREDVMRLVMGQGAVQLGMGLLMGLAGAWGVSSLLGTFLFQVEPRDPFIFAATVLVLAGTGLLASWVPARRATRVDPLLAMRTE